MVNKCTRNSSLKMYFKGHAASNGLNASIYTLPPPGGQPVPFLLADSFHPPPGGQPCARGCPGLMTIYYLRFPCAGYGLGCWLWATFRSTRSSFQKVSPLHSYHSKIAQVTLLMHEIFDNLVLCCKAVHSRSFWGGVGSTLKLRLGLEVSPTFCKKILFESLIKFIMYQCPVPVNILVLVLYRYTLFYTATNVHVITDKFCN